jgi:hypothetical protein
MLSCWKVPVAVSHIFKKKKWNQCGCLLQRKMPIILIALSAHRTLYNDTFGPVIFLGVLQSSTNLIFLQYGFLLLQNRACSSDFSGTCKLLCMTQLLTCEINTVNKCNSSSACNKQHGNKRVSALVC